MSSGRMGHCLEDFPRIEVPGGTNTVIYYPMGIIDVFRSLAMKNVGKRLISVADTYHGTATSFLDLKDL